MNEDIFCLKNHVMACCVYNKRATAITTKYKETEERGTNPPVPLVITDMSLQKRKFFYQLHLVQDRADTTHCESAEHLYAANTFCANEWLE